uniref:G-protein coupled receptors family 1 profile domain-containing protein n=1 Tax=Scleropages formosus TaxID=113540 RepID=A0A8C9RP83_SCLFO
LYNENLARMSSQLHPSCLSHIMVIDLCFLLGVPRPITMILLIVCRFRTENFTMKLMLNLASCKLLSYLVNCSQSAGVLLVTFMSVHHFIHVLYSQCWVRLCGLAERVLLLILGNFAHRNSVSSCLCPPCSRLIAAKKSPRLLFFRSQRMTKLAVIIVVTFIIFCMPVHVVSMLNVSSILLQMSYPEDVTGALTFIFSYVNAFLYAFASQNLHYDPEPLRKTCKISTRNLFRQVLLKL